MSVLWSPGCPPHSVHAEILGRCLICCLFAACPKWKNNKLQRSRLLTLGKNVLKINPGIRKEKPEVTNTLITKNQSQSLAFMDDGEKGKFMLKS